MNKKVLCRSVRAITTCAAEDNDHYGDAILIVGPRIVSLEEYFPSTAEETVDAIRLELP
jgi:hypothetical protein